MNEIVRAIPRGRPGPMGATLTPVWVNDYQVKFVNANGDQVGPTSVPLLGTEGPAGSFKNFESRTQAMASVINPSLGSIRITRDAAGAPPLGSLYVPGDPSGPRAFQEQTGNWWQMVLDGITDARKYGLRPGVDGTAALQAAINDGNVLIPPGYTSYILSGDITIPSNRIIWVQGGATIVNTGGRFSGFVPGGGNIQFVVDGSLIFQNTATRGKLGDWYANAGVQTRGLIEIGGSDAQPANNVRVTGTGLVSGDYAWPGTPPANFADINYQLNRKGICLVSLNRGAVDGLTVTGMHGEAVYWQGLPGCFDVKFTRNTVLNCGFNGLNFNSFGNQGFVISDCYVQNAWQGIEASSGTVRGNRVLGVTRGFLSGGGGGGGPLSLLHNIVTSSVYGYDVSFDPAGPAIENVIVDGNVSNNSGYYGFNFNKVSTFQCKNNIVYAHAQTGASNAATFNPSTSYGHVDGNITRGAGPFSSGAFVNQNVGANVFGTNPVF